MHAKHAELAAAGCNPGKISDGFEMFEAMWTAFYCPLGDGPEIEVNHRTHSVALDGPPTALGGSSQTTVEDRARVR